jgi:O-antigen ligase
VLADRIARTVVADDRFELIINGFLIGLQHPITGVGPGNVILHLGGVNSTHCSYAELFAASGLLPLVLFIILVVIFILEQWRRYRHTKNNLFLYFFTTGVFWAVYNFFYEFYLDLWLMSFLFLLIGHSNQYYKELCKKRERIKMNNYNLKTAT